MLNTNINNWQVRPSRTNSLPTQQYGVQTYGKPGYVDPSTGNPQTVVGGGAGKSAINSGFWMPAPNPILGVKYTQVMPSQGKVWWYNWKNGTRVEGSALNEEQTVKFNEFLAKVRLGENFEQQAQLFMNHKGELGFDLSTAQWGENGKTLAGSQDGIQQTKQKQPERQVYQPKQKGTNYEELTNYYKSMVDPTHDKEGYEQVAPGVYYKTGSGYGRAYASTVPNYDPNYDMKISASKTAKGYYKNKVSTPKKVATPAPAISINDNPAVPTAPPTKQQKLQSEWKNFGF